MLRDKVMSASATLLIIYLAASEYNRREAHQRLEAKIQSFMHVGPRFTSDQGRAMCEALRSSQIEHGIQNPIDCEKLIGD